MTRPIAAALALLAILYATGAGVLVWHGPVEDRGEGGPSFDCMYLGAMGLVRIGYFHGDTPQDEQTSPKRRSSCPWGCILERYILRLGARDVPAWRCTSN